MNILGPEFASFGNDYLRLYGNETFPTMRSRSPDRSSSSTIRSLSPNRLSSSTIRSLSPTRSYLPVRSNAEMLYDEASNNGLVVDVSNMDNAGRGAKLVHPPKTNRGTKHWIEGIPVISNNYQSYANMMNMLGPNFAQYKDEYNRRFETKTSSLVEILYNRAIKNGQVIDVSNIQTDGRGAKLVYPPKTNYGTKHWIEGIPVISNNYQSYAFMMDLLGPHFSHYKNEYADLYGAQ